MHSDSIGSLQKNSVRLLSDFCNRFKASSELIEEEKTIQSSAY